jgi:hypothetical protein
MSARETITGLLQEWLRLTQSEARAIEAASWRDVSRFQSAKAGLQPLLNRARGELIAENPSLASNAGDHPFRAEINHLIALEASNAGLLAEQKRKARSRMQSLVEARRNLGRLRGSYLPKPDRVLDSYS